MGRPVAVVAAAEASEAANLDANIAANVKLLLSAREMLEDNALVEVLPIAGVTFDGRQELVERLALQQPVLAAKEPWNPIDPTAVRIETVSGDHLGYVPRRATAFFTHEACAGHVESVGQVKDQETWGARVRLWPSLPTLQLDLLPPSWGARGDLRSALGESRWRELWARASARARHQCELTGANESPRLPLSPLPALRFDPTARVASAVGLHAVAAPIARAARLDLIRDPAEREAALKLLVGVNKWGPEDLEAYLRRVSQRRQQLEEDGWTFDAGPLAATLGG